MFIEQTETSLPAGTTTVAVWSTASGRSNADSAALSTALTSKIPCHMPRLNSGCRSVTGPGLAGR
jgi:hypothetical protein